MAIPRIATVRVYLVAAGVIAVGIAGKVAFAGLGAGTFNITTWEVILLALVGAALIALGWPWRKGKPPSAENELNEGVDAEGDA